MKSGGTTFVLRSAEASEDGTAIVPGNKISDENVITGDYGKVTVSLDNPGTYFADYINTQKFKEDIKNNDANWYDAHKNSNFKWTDYYDMLILGFGRGQASRI